MLWFVTVVIQITSSLQFRISTCGTPKNLVLRKSAPKKVSRSLAIYSRKWWLESALLLVCSQPRRRRDVNDRHLSPEVFQRIFDCKMVVRRIEWNGNCLLVVLTDIRFSSPEYTQQSKIRMSFSRSCETFWTHWTWLSSNLRTTTCFSMFGFKCPQPRRANCRFHHLKWTIQTRLRRFWSWSSEVIA